MRRTGWTRKRNQSSVGRALEQTVGFEALAVAGLGVSIRKAWQRAIRCKNSRALLGVMR